MTICETCRVKFGRTLSDRDCFCTPAPTALHNGQFHRYMTTLLPASSRAIVVGRAVERRVAKRR